MSDANVYYLIFGNSNNTAETKLYDTNLKYQSASSISYLTLGANGGKAGQLQIFQGQYYVAITPTTLTAARTLYLPNQGGTIAITSDIPSITLNGSSTTSPSFYAPTGAGTANYFLKSAGSGAPDWSQPIKYGTSLPSSGDFTGQVFILTT